MNPVLLTFLGKCPQGSAPWIDRPRSAPREGDSVRPRLVVPLRKLAAPWLAIAATAAGLAPVVALAQGGVTPAAPEAPSYATACAHGNSRYASHDFDGAIASYREAIDIDAKNPLAHYLLGEAHLASGNIADAETTWTRAASLPSDKDPMMHGRILFVLADLKERQWKWADAKAAWQAYVDWAARFPDAGVFPGSASTRIHAIDTMLEQDKAQAVVRQRIAATRDGGVFTDPSKQPSDAK
jgi:tetratricopeptide (TPR) repeat protein